MQGVQSLKYRDVTLEASAAERDVFTFQTELTGHRLFLNGLCTTGAAHSTAKWAEFYIRGHWPQHCLEESDCPTATTYVSLFPRARQRVCTTSLSGRFLSFTHPNEQLREINASNCQTIKSYIGGRIPQPAA